MEHIKKQHTQHTVEEFIVAICAFTDGAQHLYSGAFLIPFWFFVFLFLAFSLHLSLSPSLRLSVFLSSLLTLLSTVTFYIVKIYKLIYFSFLSFYIFAVIFLLHSQIALVPRWNLLISANINQRKRFIVCAQWNGEYTFIPCIPLTEERDNRTMAFVHTRWENQTKAIAEAKAKSHEPWARADNVHNLELKCCTFSSSGFLFSDEIITLNCMGLLSIQLIPITSKSLIS